MDTQVWGGSLRWAGVGLLLLGAFLAVGSGSAFAGPLLLVCIALAWAFLPLIARRPERAVLVLATIVVVSGLIGAGARVLHGIDVGEVRYSGTVDARELRMQANWDPEMFRRNGDRIVPADMGYLAEAYGVEAMPTRDSGLLSLWAAHVLAPWVLAAIALLLLAPLLRAAERDDPFLADAARRLTAVGLLLLLALPALELLQWLVASGAQGAATYSSPAADPRIKLDLLDLLPGALVLALAGIFRRGAALREFDRHAI